MGYVGNRKGPPKSIIVGNLGSSYFGKTDEELEDEIEIYKGEERKGEIDPVYVDKNGRLYLLVNAPGKKTQKYYLDEHAYRLKG